MDLKFGCSGDFLCLLFIVFLVLKLCGVISWSWWWIFAPLWIPFVIGILIVLFLLLVYFLIPDKY